MMVTGLSEALGIGLIFPYISILSNPGIIENHSILKWTFNALPISTKDELILIISFGLFIYFIFKNLFYLISQYIQQNYLIGKRVELVGTIFQGYMHSPYEFHLNHNPAFLHRNINATDQIFSGLLQPFFDILSEVIIVFCVILMLLYSNFMLSISALLLITFPTWLLNKYISQKMKILGKENFNLIGVTSKNLLEGLYGIKEIQIMNRQKYFSKSFIENSRVLGFIRRDQTIIRYIPRATLESLIILVMVGAVIFIVLSGQSIIESLPLISLFAVASVRILTSATKIIIGMNNLSFNSVVGDTIINEINEFKRQKRKSIIKNNKDVALNSFEKVELKNVSFKYLNEEKKIIDYINMTINKGQSIAIVGGSGAGKSTLIDIFLGLLKPFEGEIKVNGVSLDNCKHSWQKKIGYIPQSIYLCDDTLKNNIAFGLPEASIDMNRLNDAIQIAQLKEVVNELKEGIDTIIGDRGVKLSGGQRQRVAIARALYHDPDILIMDEATSSLDNQTEREFIKAVDRLKGQKTMIIVAHRLTTVQNCDVIYFLKNGKIDGGGNFRELVEQNLAFRKMSQYGDRTVS
nr:ABC transporter ATP-binding protein [uncultured Desulfobacter sp.]